MCTTRIAALPLGSVLHLRREIPFRLFSVLLLGKPLHVAWMILAALAQREDVVHLALVASWWFGVTSLELGQRTRVALNLASAVAWAALAFDGTPSEVERAAMTVS
jgi:hypothetical protein